MWKSLFLPEIKPFCLLITLLITRGVIHIIHKSGICRKINLDPKMTYQQVINRLSTAYQQVMHSFIAK